MASGDKNDQERQADCDFGTNSTLIIRWALLNHLDYKIDEVGAMHCAAN
jgi:hypothetical protein